MFKHQWFCGFAVLAGLLLPVVSHGQNWPTKPIRLIVPFAPGGNTDIIARAIAPKMTQELGQQILIDNRGGAGSTLGTAMAVKSPPDGYTIVIVPNSHAISAALIPTLPFDSVKDFEPITLVTSYPYVLVVHPSLPVNTVSQLLQLARSKPGEIMYASSGNGMAGHLGMELLLNSTSTPMTHVPYSGSNPALLDLQTGRVPTMFDPAATTLPLIRTQKLRALAVSTAQRFAMLPDVPTVAEASGIRDFDASGWLAILAPAKTPKVIVDRYNSELHRILQMPAVRESIERTGQQPQYSTPDELRTMLVQDIAKWAKVIEVAKITVKQ